MPFLTILSPHQDDAGLSLAFAIRAASRAGFGVRIVNCFTVSAYAPHSDARTAEAVGAVRRAEDREFASRVGHGVEVIDLNLEDAPLRLRCPLEEVRRRRVGRFERAEAEYVAAAACKVAEGTVLAPLGIGRHIDHLVVREAGIRLARSGRAVMFYEDLPYAAEMRECCVLRAADDVSRSLSVRLRAGLAPGRGAASSKRFAVEAYRSQLSRPQFDSVIGYGERLGGERVWGAAGLEESIPRLESAGIETAIAAVAWRRWLHCAAHAAAGRALALPRRIAAWSLRGGLDAPQTN